VSALVEQDTPWKRQEAEEADQARRDKDARLRFVELAEKQDADGEQRARAEREHQDEPEEPLPDRDVHDSKLTLQPDGDQTA
jgi:hypothetical protein